jgi:uncharacterized protein (TIGR02001 family)
MKAATTILLAGLAGCAAAGRACASDRPLGLTLNIGAATDYVFRGVSQTQGDGEAFGGADISFAKIGYAGTWISNVDFGDSTRLEYDLYAGVKPVLGPVTFDFGALRYGYTHVPEGAEWTYWELKAAGSMALGPATVGASAFYSPNATGPGKIEAYYFELNGALPIPNSRLSVSGALGRQSYDGPGDYTTWNAGLGYALTDKVGFDLRYWDTDEHRFGKSYKARFVVSAKAIF